jgi:hypothetical protein
VLEPFVEDASNECHSESLATTLNVNPSSSLLDPNPIRRRRSIVNVVEDDPVSRIPRTLESLQNESVLLIKLFRFVDKEFKFVHIQWDDENEPDCEHISVDVLNLFSIPEDCWIEAWTNFDTNGGAEAPFTWATGVRSSSTIPKGLRTQILVKYRNSRGYCLLYSILNGVEADIFPTNEKEFVDTFGCTHGSMKKLAKVASATLGINVIKISDPSSHSIDWLLSRDEGLYIIVSGSHAISVDAKRKLIFDCAYPYALKLSLKSLTFCRCFTIDIIRRIQLPHHLLINQAA